MKKNVSGADRILRVILGVAVIGLGLYFKCWWGIVGIVPLATGLLNFCPAYTLIGVSTSKKIETDKLKV